MARGGAHWPPDARLLLALLVLLIYATAISRLKGVTQLRWQAENVPIASPGIMLSSSSAASTGSKAAGVIASSSQSLDTAAKAAIAAAAKQSVVIGLQRSGQWLFWQAISAPERIGDLGVRAQTNMQGPRMDAQHPEWVRARRHQLHDQFESSQNYKWQLPVRYRYYCKLHMQQLQA
jgi:hypothetical protein